MVDEILKEWLEEDLVRREELIAELATLRGQFEAALVAEELAANDHKALRAAISSKLGSKLLVSSINTRLIAKKAKPLEIPSALIKGQIGNAEFNLAVLDESISQLKFLLTPPDVPEVEPEWDPPIKKIVPPETITFNREAAE